MRTEAAFLLRADISPRRITEAHRMAQRPQGGTSSARNGKRESFLFSGSQENRRAHPPLFFPDHRQRATSCISWRRITPGQHRQQAAAILRQMRTEAAFLRGAASSACIRITAAGYQLHTGRAQLAEAITGSTGRGAEAHPPPEEGKEEGKEGGKVL